MLILLIWGGFRWSFLPARAVGTGVVFSFPSLVLTLNSRAKGDLQAREHTQLKIVKWQLYTLSKTSLKRFVPVERAEPVGTADLGSPTVPASLPMVRAASSTAVGSLCAPLPRKGWMSPIFKINLYQGICTNRIFHSQLKLEALGLGRLKWL